MESLSGSKRPLQPPSSPPPPPRRVRRRRKQASPEQDKEKREVEAEGEPVIIKRSPRKHGKDIHQEPADDDPDPEETSEEAKRRPISLQDYQELSEPERDELQFAASDLFLSNDPYRYLFFVCDFTSSSVLHKNNPLSQVKELWNFCARHYPNSLSLMLARLLNSAALPRDSGIYIVNLLHLTLNRIHRHDPSRIQERVLSRVKCRLFNIIHNHESIPNMVHLSEVVARMFETGRWGEILDYLLQALHTRSETRQEMALRVLLSLPEMREECPSAYDFWRDNYEELYYIFIQLFDSPNPNIQALSFDASVKLIRLLRRWALCNEIDHLLTKMIGLLRTFHEDGQIEIMEPRIMDLVQLARYYAEHFLNRLEVVLDCMFQIAVTPDDNTFLKCQAIQIIEILHDEAMLQVSEFLLHKLSEEAKRSILDNCVRMMFCIEDVPGWYDLDMESSEDAGVSGSYHFGKLLLFWVCMHSNDDLLVSFGIEMIPHYLNSEDWQKRHAGMIAFAVIAFRCAQELIRDQAERVLDISLSDPHPRVRWAAIEVIICSTTDSDHKKHVVRYLNKFLPKLVTIIRSASTYPRLQFHAAVVIRPLINNCDREDVKSFPEDLVPELLKFLMQGEKFRDEAVETLTSLAVLSPVIFRRYYKETVDSLKPFISQSLLGAKTIECLSCIFSGFLRVTSFDDVLGVFLFVLRIANNWTSTDRRVRIHIFKALPQLCKLPRLEADSFLKNIMPIVILTLDNTNIVSDNTVMKVTIREKTPTCPELILLACDLVSKFAVRFEQKFAPWASRVAPLLMRLLRTDDVDAKIASAEALPSVLLSCQHRKESQRSLFNLTVEALVKALQEEFVRANGIVMLNSLNECIAMAGSVLEVDVIQQIADMIHQVLSQQSFSNMQKEIGGGESSSHSIDKLEQEEEIIQGAKCLVTMIDTLKPAAFLAHVEELLPAVEALWGRDNEYPDRVKAVAISIFNLILKDYPDQLQRYRDTYARVVMDACYSETSELQQEGARGIGLCAINRRVISNLDAPAAIDSLYNVIECRTMGSAERMTCEFDVAVSAIGKICEFWRHTINGPQVVPIWLNFLPLRNDFKEAKDAHRQLCQMVERFDQDLLGSNNENLVQAIQILNEILSQSDYLATEETTRSIICLLTQLGANQ